MAGYRRREHAGAAAPTNLNGSITAGGLSILCVDLTGYPTGATGAFTVTVDDGLTTEEHILCDSRSGNTLTVNAAGRGYDGTTAQAHGATAPIHHGFSGIEADENNQWTSLLTTKGDLPASNGTTPVRVPVGSNSQVLIADSTQAAGVRWSFLGAGSLDPDSVDSSEIVAGAVGTTELAALAVTTAKIASGNITEILLAAGLGRIFYGTSHPGAPLEGWVSIRTDLDRWYIYNGSAWVLAGWYAHTARVGADLQRNSTQSIPHATDTAIIWNVENYDSDGGFTASSTTYTVPFDGVYSILCSAAWAASPGTISFMTILAAGFPVMNVPQPSFNSINASMTLNLTAGQTIAVNIYQNSGGALNLTANPRLLINKVA